MQQNGKWLSIIDYANLTGISISTIRRHIKKDKLQHKDQDGKYYIYSDLKNETLPIKTENQADLRKIILKQQEEIDDLKTLVMYYETNVSTNNNSQLQR